MNMFYLPQNSYEWVMAVIIILLLVCLLLWNKALLKSKNIIESYVNDIRLYDKYLLSIGSDDDFEKFKSERVTISSGDTDV